MACAKHVDLQLRNSVESYVQYTAASGERMVNVTANCLSPAGAGYAELQREIHVALRAQHPEWIQPNGESPTCDFYDSRLAELLRTLPRRPGTKNAPRFANYAVHPRGHCSEDRITKRTCHYQSHHEHNAYN